MAPTQRQREHLTQKLENIKREKETLYQTFADYVERVESVAKKWLDDSDTMLLSFHEMCVLLEKCLAFTMDKSDEISEAGHCASDAATATPTSSLQFDTTTASTSVKTVTALSSALCWDPSVEQLLERIDNLESDCQRYKELEGKIEQIETDRRDKDDKRMTVLEDKLREHEITLVAVQNTKEYYITGHGEEFTKKMENLDEKLQQLEILLANFQTEKADTFKLEEDFNKKMESLEDRLRKHEILLTGAQNAKEDMTKLEEEVKHKSEMTENGLHELKAEQEKVLKELDAVKSNISTCQTHLEAVETKSRKEQPFGFTASLNKAYVIYKAKTVIDDFEQSESMRSKHFDDRSGIFTAPVDGFYITSFCHTQYGGDEWQKFQVVCERGVSVLGKEREEGVCCTWTSRNCSSCSGMSVVYMSAGDRLYVQAETGGCITWPSSFSCFLIG